MDFYAPEVEPCPECGSTERIEDPSRAEVTCARCGLVLDENLIDKGPEYRAFNHEQRAARTRVGAPLVYGIADRGLSTDIAYGNKDCNGRIIPEANRAQISRIRRWHKRMRVSGVGQRNLAYALSEMDRLSSKLDLKRSVREDAAYIYRQAARNNLIRGRSIESMVAAAVYTACRRCNIPRTLDEISQQSNVSKKQLGKNYRFLSRELNIKLKPTSPADYIPRFASKLGVSNIVESRAIDIIRKSIEKGLNSGKGPTGMAAAALYIASILSNERVTQGKIADAAGVTEVTIRNRYKELSEQLDFGASL